MCWLVVAAGLAGLSSYIGAKTSAASSRAQAQVHQRQALLEREKGAYAGARAAEKGRQLIGRQVAGYSSQGIAANTGTPLDVISKTGSDIALDVAAIRYGSRIASENEGVLARVNNMNASTTERWAPLGAATAAVGTYTSLTGSYGG